MRPRVFGRYRIVSLVVLGICVILIGVRLLLPQAVKHYINAKIDELPGYSGNVTDVDLGLLRGIIGLKELVLFRDSFSSDTPVFKSKYIKVNIDWTWLVKGALVAQVYVDSPNAQIVFQTKQEVKTEPPKLARDAKKAEAKVEDILAMFPVNIDELKVRNGFIAFKRTDTRPDINVYMSDVTVDADNLTNSLKVTKSYVGRANIRAKAMNSADFDMFLSLNPWTTPLSFKIKSRLQQLPLVSLNPVVKEYGNFDFERGTADIIVEADIREAKIEGYVKPIFRDVEVASSKDKSRDRDNFFQRLWENIVGATEEIVENQPKDQSGTRIPLKGNLSEASTDIYTAVYEVLLNAYVEALLPNYEWSENKTAH